MIAKSRPRTLILEYIQPGGEKTALSLLRGTRHLQWELKSHRSRGACAR